MTAAENETSEEMRDPLPRLTRKVFTDLGIWMMGLGLVMGVVFPFFVMLMGVPSRYVMTPLFFVATVSAGLAVGASNQLLSKAVVGSRLRFLRARMSKVETNLRSTIYSDDPSSCTPEACSIPVDSDDELGAAAASFNRLVEALATSHQVGQVSRDFAATLASHVELLPLANAALRGIEAAGGFAASALCVVREGEMVTIASNGLMSPEALAESDPVIRAYRSLETVRLDLPENLPIDGGLVTFRARTVLALPLQLRQVPVGVLVVGSTAEVAVDDERTVQQLLPGLAVAVNNALSHERLQQVAAIDALTGLVNRRFGLERLSEEFSRAVRTREPLGVVLFDIDHFKSINDTFGHQSGDRVLRAVADAARGALREGDTVMRYGGEEFLAVLPGAGNDDLAELGERIRREIEIGASIPELGDTTVTVSLGAVSFPSTDVANLDDLVRHADAAMYVAKAAGRNRLTFATV